MEARGDLVSALATLEAGEEVCAGALLSLLHLPSLVVWLCVDADAKDDDCRISDANLPEIAASGDLHGAAANPQPSSARSAQAAQKTSSAANLKTEK